LVVAVGAVAALVLHACASTESSKHASPPMQQAVAADPGSNENENATPKPNATANPPATAAGDDDDDNAPYMPATKAGPGIVLSKPKTPKTQKSAPPQMQNANAP
jgi:hypothetical protein